MNLLVAEKLLKSYTEKILFENVSFGLEEGEKIGLIGVNGTGKSTFLRVIAGLEEADEGRVVRNSCLKISYLPQAPVFDSKKTLLENVIKDQKASEDYRNISGEAIAMLERLGIIDYNCNPDLLSGGQKKRAMLVKTLLSESNLLVLDEPTNHLDSEMTEWLEETLRKYKGAVLMVTHDRYFLDEVTNRILELDKGKLYSYTANYSRFVELKAQREEMEQAGERKNKSLYKTELAWMLRGARARSTKQKAHIERFKKLRERERPEEEGQIEISSAYTRIGKKTVEINNISKKYGEKVLIADFTYYLLQNERIGIIGPNGCGKTTLLRLMMGQLPPDSGNIVLGSTVRFGYFAQDNTVLDENRKVLDYIRETAESIKTKEGVVTASKMCERFLFDSTMQYTMIGKLSGGEKRRLFLLKVLMSAPNILVLDEPTNDLDIQTLTILEDYLQSFEGIVVTVSHDRYFMDKVVSRLFVFQKNGMIEQVEGNYTDYRDKIEEKEQNQACRTEEKNKNERISSKSTRQIKLKFTYQEQKEYNSIDEEIRTLEDRLRRLEDEINAAETNYGKLTELFEHKDTVEAELEGKMERWMYLTELAEQINQQ